MRSDVMRRLVKEAWQVALEEPGSGRMNAEADAKGLIFSIDVGQAVQEEDFGFSMESERKRRGREVGDGQHYWILGVAS
jgi:hypothetical protein